MRYFVSFNAVYNVTSIVEADSEDEAIANAKDGRTVGEEEEFAYIHPETEFFVEADEEENE